MAKDLTTDDFEKTIKDTEGVVLVDFWAAWCAPCRALSPILEKLDEEHGDKASVFKLNVDENPEIAQEHGVRGIPTVKIFKDGEEVKSLVGLMPKSEYEKYIEEYA